jgi:hypothetical protein
MSINKNNITKPGMMQHAYNHDSQGSIGGSPIWGHPVPQSVNHSQTKENIIILSIYTPSLKHLIVWNKC